MFGYLIRGLLLGLPAAAQPGPFQAYILSQTLKNGWRRTLPAALAPLFSDGPIILLVLLILTRLPPTFLAALQLFGGLFLLYLALGAWRAFRTFAPMQVATGEVARQSLLEASVMNLLNPNPYLFWSAIGGPILLEAWRTSAVHALAYLLGFYGTMLGGSALLIILFGVARDASTAVTHGLLALSALALGAFGLYQLWNGLGTVLALLG